MKKNITLKLISTMLIITASFILLNRTVTSKHCIDYKCSALNMPLYLKVLDFFDRHFNYVQLVKKIIKNTYTNEERILKILEWTNKNIKKVPEGLPIIDDHVWSIIVRGYGTSDQSSDVFATLCNYAGAKAFYLWGYTQDKTKKIALAFVNINLTWHVFDPYRGNYFRNREGALATIEDIAKGNWIAVNISEMGKFNFDYSVYLENIPSAIKNNFSRSAIQSPVSRIIYQIKYCFRYILK